MVQHGKLLQPAVASSTAVTSTADLTNSPQPMATISGAQFETLKNILNIQQQQQQQQPVDKSTNIQFPSTIPQQNSVTQSASQPRIAISQSAPSQNVCLILPQVTSHQQPVSGISILPQTSLPELVAQSQSASGTVIQRPITAQGNGQQNILPAPIQKQLISNNGNISPMSGQSVSVPPAVTSKNNSVPVAPPIMHTAPQIPAVPPVISTGQHVVSSAPPILPVGIPQVLQMINQEQAQALGLPPDTRLILRVDPTQLSSTDQNPCLEGKGSTGQSLQIPQGHTVSSSPVIQHSDSGSIGNQETVGDTATDIGTAVDQAITYVINDADQAFDVARKITESEALSSKHNHPFYQTPKSTAFGHYCVDCNDTYHSVCAQHGNFYVEVKDAPISSRARMSLPEQLKLTVSDTSLSDIKFTGIFAKEKISKGTKFGPLIGAVLMMSQTIQELEKSSNIWKICNEDHKYHYIHCTNEDTSNWMMFVRKARATREQNIVAYQEGLNIFFITCKDIEPGAELLYWYSRPYSKYLGVPSAPNEYYSCSICKKDFVEFHHLKQHMIFRHADTSKNRFQCPKCPKSFQNAQKLDAHADIHFGIKRHKCSYCNKGFSDSSNLRIHLRIHTGEKKHQCPVCNKSFRQKAHLQSHEVIHTGQKNIACTKCDKFFARMIDLNQHMHQHSTEKKYQCQICNKGFHKQQNLVKHCKVHTQQRDFKCTECGKGFYTKFHLDRHASKVHKYIDELVMDKKNKRKKNKPEKHATKETEMKS
ncbi:unnamed protein product [Owenia fusiformis]|uniref:PR domain zinc finger protein 10 n=1 Tax=Owenia fusiformis TaxID=6347 RepID=A0A8S4Q1P1_OWEFU|nr:unnamed protein product [Owenia fusiformis]